MRSAGPGLKNSIFLIYKNPPSLRIMKIFTNADWSWERKCFVISVILVSKRVSHWQQTLFSFPQELNFCMISFVYLVSRLHHFWHTYFLIFHLDKYIKDF